MKLSIKKTLMNLLSISSWSDSTTYANVEARKFGPVVHVRWYGKSQVFPKNSWVDLATLPNKFKPTAEINCVSFENNGSSSTSGSAFYDTRIYTSGRLAVWVWSGINTNSPMGSVTYILGGVVRNLITSLRKGVMA